jgi:hypothetical protein
VRNLYSHSVANRDFHNSFKFIKQSWGDRVGHEITYQARDVSDKFTTFDDKLVVDVGGGENRLKYSILAQVIHLAQP